MILPLQVDSMASILLKSNVSLGQSLAILHCFAQYLNSEVKEKVKNLNGEMWSLNMHSPTYE